MAADRVCGLEAHPLTDREVEGVDFVVVALEQLQEGSLRARRAANTPETQRRDPVVELLQVQKKILNPEGRAFADCGGLGGLEVGVPEGRELRVLAGEPCEGLHTTCDPGAREFEGCPVQDQVGVVTDEGTRRAEMDDPGGGRGVIPEEMNVRHHVVSKAAFVLGGPL
jgi:hypothetical protein